MSSDEQEEDLGAWSFNVEEVSSGVYTATGVDVVGRRIQRTGSEPDQLMAGCSRAAASIVRELRQRAACCDQKPDRYPGKQLKDIPELSDVSEVPIDSREWVTKFRCNRCGCVWQERFVERGHGEVPEVVKSPATPRAPEAT